MPFVHIHARTRVHVTRPGSRARLRSPEVFKSILHSKLVVLATLIMRIYIWISIDLDREFKFQEHVYMYTCRTSSFLGTGEGLHGPTLGHAQLSALTHEPGRAGLDTFGLYIY